MVLEKVWEDICRKKLFEIGDFVVLAVSGGADSMVMLHILNSLSKRLDLRLHVAHLNHMLRGTEAQEDAVFVQDAAEGMGLHCSIGVVDVSSIAAEQKLSIEEAARKARYDFLFQTAQELGADKIAVAHHADDQAETLVLHLLNGTGLEGLSGMKPVLGRVVRPLLTIRRKEIENFCSTSGIPFRKDSSNYEWKFPRNKIRHQLIPILMEYNPNIIEVLTRTAEIIRVENDYIERETTLVYNNAVTVSEGIFCVGTEDFAGLDTALQRRLTRNLFKELAGKDESLEFSQVERVREFIVSGQTGKRLELPKNVLVEKSYSEVKFLTADDRADYAMENNPWRVYPIVIPGITDLPAVNVRIIAAVFPLAAVREQVFEAPPEDAYLDLNKLAFPLIAGPKREGDVFHPLGCAGSKKIKNFLIDKKVPQRKRELVPVLYDGNGIVWVTGLSIDDRVKVTDSTVQVLRLQIRQNQK